MRQNIEELPALIQLAHTLHVDRILVIHLTVHDGINKDQLLDQPEYLDLTTTVFNASKALAHELGIELRLPVLMNPLTKKFAETQEEIDATKKGIDPRISTDGLCLEPWQTFYLRSNGDVMPCVITNRCMGNLTNQTAEEVWNGALFQSFRKRMKSNDKPPECKVCHLLPGNRVLDKKLYYDPSFYESEL
jgi:radical SAM protein with 4Fe4S-binding SPASM domain